MPSEPQETESISCAEVDDLAGAYALGALSEEEHARVEAHLATCPQPHADLRDFCETAALLALAVPALDPPPSLRDRIMASATAGGTMEAGGTPEGMPGAGEEAGTIPPSNRTAPVLLRPWYRPPRVLPYALAAAFALLALGLGAWGAAQQRALRQQRVETARDAAVLADLSSGSLAVETAAAGSLHPAIIVQPSNGGPAYLLLDWPAPAGGKSYQAWLIAQGQKPVNAGVFAGTQGGFQIVRLAHSLSGAQVFAVTLEPRGGSPQPTTQPFLIRPLPTA